MNLRKFYFIITVVMSVFLFVAGSFVLSFISSMDVSEVSADSEVENNTIKDIFKNFVIGNDPVNIIVMVGDKSGANTDTMMLVNFNPKTDKLNILSIPRDTKVNIPGMEIPKINGVYARKNGPKLLIDTVSEMFDVNVKYYIHLDIKTFRQVIDLLGGVEINVPVNMDYDDPTQNLHIHLKKGKQVLDGKKAEQYLRFRHPNGAYTKEMLKYYDGSDLKRIQAQQGFIKELIRQKANIFYFAKINEIIDIVYDNLKTNITMNEIMKLAKNINNFKSENVKMFTLPGKTQSKGYSYFIYDKEKTLEIIKGNFDASASLADFPDIDNGKTSAGTSSNNKTSSSDTKNTVSQGKTDVTKNNPSNSKSNIKGDPVPKP